MSSPARLFPETSAVSFVAAEELRGRKLQRGYEYWRSLRGERRFPAREELQPRAIAGVLSNMVLIKVIDGGADYQFRIVGDHAGQGFDTPLRDRALSEVAADLPQAAANWRQMIDRVVTSGEPVAARVSVGRDAAYANYTDAEVVYLPLGNADNDVNFVLSFVEHTSKI
jgi:hypothetical protein